MVLPADVLEQLGPLAAPAEEAAIGLVEADARRRVADGDHTLWRPDPTEIADRLGWLPVVAEMAEVLDDLTARCRRLAGEADRVLVMGMGGSSLFPEVIGRFTDDTAGDGAGAGGRRRIVVLDSTDPAAVARAGAACPPARSVYLASSKSGTTVETRSHLEWAWWAAGGDAPFGVVTDPGSALAALAADRSFAEIFENRADIGGRYSALSYFGLVPAVLAGADVPALLAGGRRGLAAPPEPALDAALALAAAMAAGARTGRDKLTFELHGPGRHLGPWLEQLVAESLGKDGTGLVPVVDEVEGPPEVYGDDRLFVVDGLGDPARVDALRAAGHAVLALPPAGSAEQLGWWVTTTELATALAGAAIGVHPFDQPDVAAAKAATQRVLDGDRTSVRHERAGDLLGLVQPGDHLALHAFVDPAGEAAAALVEVRARLRDRLGVAVTLGFGPRFLHSTGQLHKGGPPSIVCAQVLGDDADDVEIPGRGHGFGHLKRAQADGDLLVLAERGIRAGRVALDELVEAAR